MSHSAVNPNGSTWSSAINGPSAINRLSAKTWPKLGRAATPGKRWAVIAGLIFAMATAVSLPPAPASAVDADSAAAIAKEREAIRQQKQAIDQRLKKLENLYIPKHWSDPATGFALGGYDPIAYFEQGEPRPGREEYEVYWHGTSWRFATIGNMRIFKQAPSIYAPHYAGYDPYALSNNILAEGEPVIWSVTNGKLYIFQNEVNKYLWTERHSKLMPDAEANWAILSQDLPSFRIISND